jgi:hypothetical protein
MARPASVTVFGVLNIVFGVLGLLSGAASLGIMIAVANGAFPDNAGLGEQPALMLWTLAASALGIVFAIVLFASGIGLLRMRPWGRTAALAYAGYAVFSTVVGMAIHWIYVAQPLLAEQGPGGRTDPAQIGGAIGGMVGGCLGLVYPILLWYFMPRPAVVAALAGGVSASDEGLFAPTASLEPEVARDPHNPYVAPRTDSVPLTATAAGDSIVETFVPTKNAPALWSYYLGLFSLFPCFGFFLAIPAVIMGVKGLRLVRANPEVRGGAHAWVGLICGSLFGLFNFLLLVVSIFGFIAILTEKR